MRIFVLLSLMAISAFSCQAPDDASGGATSISNASAPPDSSSSDPHNSAFPSTSTTPGAPPAGTPTGSSGPIPPAGSGAHAYSTDVLLYNGTGVSTSDWQSTESIVKGHGLSYQLVNAAQLNAMGLSEITNFGLIIVPGGAGGTIASNLTPATRLNLRQAVRDYGVNYLGFCAGAWVAVGPEALTDSTASYGFAVAKGNVLDLFLPGGKSPTAAIVPVTFPDGSLRDLVWWGGPITPEWKNGVIARYDTGVPAISETFSGKGFVVVSGPHPEAPQGWRATAGNDPDGLDYDLTIRLIDAALKQAPLPAF